MSCSWLMSTLCYGPRLSVHCRAFRLLKIGFDTWDCEGYHGYLFLGWQLRHVLAKAKPNLYVKSEPGNNLHCMVPCAVCCTSCYENLALQIRCFFVLSVSRQLCSPSPTSTARSLRCFWVLSMRISWRISTILFLSAKTMVSTASA